MDTVFHRLTPVFHLTRITMGFAAVANTWWIILWSRASSRESSAAPDQLVEFPLPLLLAGGVALAVGLFSFGMALNDTIDIRRDRALHPDRPLASGRMSVEVAVTWSAGALLVAILGAAVLNIAAVIMCVGTALAIMVYAAAVRFVPAFGLVLLGLIYGAQMMAANVHLVFVLPVWVAMTHALLTGAAYHHLMGTSPRLSGRVLAAALLGYLFWSAILFAVGSRRAGGLWPEHVDLVVLAPIILLAGVFAAFARHKVRRAGTRRAAAEKVQRYGSFWLSLYATAWMFAAGHPAEGWLLLALAGVGLLGMTVIREAVSLIDQPIGYRR